MMSIILYLSGIAYMFMPEIPVLALCIFSGILLIIYGIIKIVGYLSNDLYCLAFQYDLACGLLLIVLGGIVLGCNDRISGYMSTGLGVLVLFDSLLTIQTAHEAKKFGLETWNTILAFSVMAGIFGALIIIKPYDAVRTAHILAGVALLTEGAMKHCVVHCTVKIMNTLPKEEENEE